MWFDGESSARRLRLCLLLCALACAAGARAGEVEGLYETQVPVTGQREAERVDALRTAFRQVLVKVTGDRGAASHQAVQTLARSPLGYVQQYLYRPLPPDYTPAAAADPAPTQMLWVRFDAQAVDLLLQQANEPVWGRMRPTTLVWLAVEDHGRRALAGSDSLPELRSELEDQAEARGVWTCESGYQLVGDAGGAATCSDPGSDLGDLTRPSLFFLSPSPLHRFLFTFYLFG